MAGMFAGGKLAPRTTQRRMNTAAGSPSRPSGGRVAKSGPYPSPVTGGGMAGSAGKTDAGTPTSHPMSRKPKVC